MIDWLVGWFGQFGWFVLVWVGLVCLVVFNSLVG
jgi:hypothetical protein